LAIGFLCDFSGKKMGHLKMTLGQWDRRHGGGRRASANGFFCEFAEGGKKGEMAGYGLACELGGGGVSRNMPICTEIDMNFFQNFLSISIRIYME
jgi:hypothetical protein